MRAIVIFGKPGSGKDTQANLLSKKLKIKILNIGEILRNNLKILTDEQREVVNRGNLLSDKTIQSIVDNQINLNHYEKIIFNGYPRTIGQAKGLINICKKPIIIVLNISDKESKQRLLQRKDGRVDDKEDVISKRIEQYHKQTKKIIDFFKQLNLNLIEINGEQTIKKIAEEIYKKIYDKI